MQTQAVKERELEGKQPRRMTVVLRVVSSAWSLQPQFCDTLGIFSDLRYRDERVHFERKCMLLRKIQSRMNATVTVFVHTERLSY